MLIYLYSSKFHEKNIELEREISTALFISGFESLLKIPKNDLKT